jgi:hypothetical protein
MSDSGIATSARPERPPTRDRGDIGDRGHDQRFSAMRGAALVGLAIIIGLVLLSKIDDGSSGPVVATTAKPSTSATTSAGSATTAPSAPANTGTTRPPSQVTVLVENGAGVSGIAGNQTTALKNAGYTTLDPRDASQQRQGTIVYYSSGFQRECTAVASSISANATTAALPSPPPSGAESVNCLVILGS